MPGPPSDSCPKPSRSMPATSCSTSPSAGQGRCFEGRESVPRWRPRILPPLVARFRFVLAEQRRCTSASTMPANTRPSGGAASEIDFGRRVRDYTSARTRDRAFLPRRSGRRSNKVAYRPNSRPAARRHRPGPASTRASSMPCAANDFPLKPHRNRSGGSSWYSTRYDRLRVHQPESSGLAGRSAGCLLPHRRSICHD